MSSLRTAMNWFRVHYDRVAALAATLFFLGSAIMIARSISQFSENFSTLSIAPPPQSALPPSQIGELARAAVALRQPAQWTFSGRSGLFVPEKHFIDAHGFPATLQTTEVHPPVPNEWWEEFGLPIADTDVLTQDPDSDGFTNLEEWEGRTNPNHRDFHPPFVVKLKLKSLAQEPFRLVFASWVDDTFAINSSDLREPTQFLKHGDSIRGTNFRLVKFAEKYDANKYGAKIDVSELTLEHQETGEQLTLVKERIMSSPTPVASFVYFWGGRQEFTARKEQQFSLKPNEQVKYKLIDVQPAKALIVNIQKPNEPIEIGLLKP